MVTGWVDAEMFLENSSPQDGWEAGFLVSGAGVFVVGGGGVLFLITVWLALCGLKLVEFVRRGRGGTES